MAFRICEQIALLLEEFVYFKCWIKFIKDAIVDVVRAYKGLNAEKDALQATVEALSAQDAPLCGRYS